METKTILPSNIEGVKELIRVRNYYPDGQLMYETFFAEILPEKEDLFKRIIISHDGKLLIRVGRTRRYYMNGQLHWQMKFELNGELTTEKTPSYHSDGTIIQY